MMDKWTTEKPTKIGWYWANWICGEIRVVKVIDDKWNPGGLSVYGDECDYRLKDFTHWLGPLHEPEPPEAKE